MELDGRPAFATGDLFSPHPTGKKDLWRICGRKDDQIMHSNGEKTNPGPMGKVKHFVSPSPEPHQPFLVPETIISKHPAVSKALMFGREQFNTGVIIEPASSAFLDPKDEASRKAYIDEIWQVQIDLCILSITDFDQAKCGRGQRSSSFALSSI